MNRKFSTILLSTSIFLSGCAGVKEGEYLGGFVKVERIDQSSNSSEKKVTESKVGKSNEADNSAKANAQGLCWIGCKSKEPSPMSDFEFKLEGIDVDTAYVRIKREFNFKSRSERLEANPKLDGYLEHTLDFRYQATPGVNYLMRGYKPHSYGSEETPNTIQVELFKDGSERISVKVSFYSGSIKDVEGYKDSLKSRIIAASKS